MSQRKTRIRRSRAGFTLMELLLVMAILVILLSLVAPRFMNTQSKANIGAAKSQIGLFKTPLLMYQQSLNKFPTTEQGLVALVEAPAELEQPEKWEAQLENIPKDPWGHDYQYRYPAEKNTHDFPDIWSLGPDGEDGTDDDIGNWPAETEGEGEVVAN